jgi:tight adherence protein B
MIEYGSSIYWELTVFFLAGSGLSGLAILLRYRKLMIAQKKSLSVLDHKFTETGQPASTPLLNEGLKIRRKINISRYLSWGASLVVCAELLLLLIGKASEPVLLIGAALFILSVMLWAIHKVWLNRHQRVIATQFPQALEMLVRGAKVGQSLDATFLQMGRELEAPLSQTFTSLSAKLAIGQPLDQSLAEVANTQDLPEFQFMANALIIQRKTGGQYSEILERLQLRIRERFNQREETRALTAEGRTAAAVVIILTVIVITFLGAVNPGHFRFLIEDPAGQDLLLYSILSIGLGVFCIYQLLELMND